jgi:hypothetical protein
MKPVSEAVRSNSFAKIPTTAEKLYNRRHPMNMDISIETKI